MIDTQSMMNNITDMRNLAVRRMLQEGYSLRHEPIERVPDGISYLEVKPFTTMSVVQLNPYFRGPARRHLENALACPFNASYCFFEGYDDEVAPLPKDWMEWAATGVADYLGMTEIGQNVSYYYIPDEPDREAFRGLTRAEVVKIFRAIIIETVGPIPSGYDTSDVSPWAEIAQKEPYDAYYVDDPYVDGETILMMPALMGEATFSAARGIVRFLQFRGVMAESYHPHHPEQTDDCNLRRDFISLIADIIWLAKLLGEPNDAIVQVNKAVAA